MTPPTGAPVDVLHDFVEERSRANHAFFAAEADRLAGVCHLMAERCARGGRLIGLGRSAAARSDARHVAVEFVHPVIVGKRALPALALTGEGGTVTEPLALLVGPDDIVLGFGTRAGQDLGSEDVVAALRLARGRGALTLGFSPGSGAEHVFLAPTEDPSVHQELVETLYHVLWELVHVFFEHRGLLSGRATRAHHDAGASAFLYPFLDEREDRLEPVLADVARSVVMKSEEIGALRVQTLAENDGALRAAADAMRARLDAGGRVLALGNGGSATDAMDVVADLRSPAGGRTPRASLDLTEDPGIITAIANDIGVEAIFMRQVIAYGAAEDVLLTLSTSGNSANVIAALAQARRQAMVTIALVGYDGGRVAAEGLADHVVITRSEHIPRIQEAQASAYHALRELVG